MPGLHPRKPLNCVNKPVTEFRCNSLNSDLKEKFLLRLHRYLPKLLGCSKGGRDALWSCEQHGAGREGRCNCPQLLKSSWDTNSFAVFTVVDNTSSSAYTTVDDVFSPSLPFKLFPSLYAIVGCAPLLLLGISTKKTHMKKCAVLRELQAQRGGSACGSEDGDGTGEEGAAACLRCH